VKTTYKSGYKTAKPMTNRILIVKERFFPNPKNPLLLSCKPLQVRVAAKAGITDLKTAGAISGLRFVASNGQLFYLPMQKGIFNSIHLIFKYS